jgi:hypothetical protein
VWVRSDLHWWNRARRTQRGLGQHRKDCCCTAIATWPTFQGRLSRAMQRKGPEPDSPVKRGLPRGGLACLTKHNFSLNKNGLVRFRQVATAQAWKASYDSVCGARRAGHDLQATQSRTARTSDGGLCEWFPVALTRIYLRTGTLFELPSRFRAIPVEYRQDKLRSVVDMVDRCVVPAQGDAATFSTTWCKSPAITSISAPKPSQLLFLPSRLTLIQLRCSAPFGTEQNQRSPIAVRREIIVAFCNTPDPYHSQR